MRPAPWGRFAATALSFAGLSGTAFAQTAPPAPGQILKNIEQSLPGRPMASPGELNIQVPEAPAATPESMAARITVRGYRITGNTVFDQQTLLGVIGSYVGRLTLAELQAAAREITRYYREHGYMVARAYVPQQRVAGGIVTIAVLEGQFDRIDTHGASRVGDERVRRTVGKAVCPHGSECLGALVERDAVERGLLILDDTPGVQAAARLSQGEEIGTSRLDVEVAPTPLLTGSASLDNGGDYYTGSLRAISNLWINSPAGIGDQVSLQAVGSIIHGDLGYGALGYSLPLGYDGLRFGLRGWDMYYKLGADYSYLGAHGIAYGGDATLTYPFIRSVDANVYGSLSYGDRRFHDYSDAVGVSDTRRISDRVEAALSGDFQDELFGVPAYNNYSIVYAQGRMGLDAALSAVDALSARTAGRYDKMNVQVSRLQTIFTRSALYVRALAQSSSKNLDAYEKLSLGGPDAVRAYPAGDSLADKGFLYTVEWRQRLAQLWRGALEGTVFYDYATGRTNAFPWQPRPNGVVLHGPGVGLNWALPDQTTLRSFVAFRGDRPWTAAPDHGAEYGLLLSTVF